MLFLDCPICMMLASTPPLTILEPTLLNLHTDAINEQTKGDIDTWGASWSDTLIICMYVSGFMFTNKYKNEELLLYLSYILK